MDLREPLSLHHAKLDQIPAYGIYIPYILYMEYISHHVGNAVILYTQGQYIAASKHAFPRESEVVPTYSHSYVKSG